MSTPDVSMPPSRRATWEKWFLGYPGMFVALVWGFAEGTFFFIIPDVFLSYAAILDWPRTWKHLAAATAGALLGGALLFQWSTASPIKAHAEIMRVPFVKEDMFSEVDEGFRTRGLPAIFFGSISGIPYKLYAVEAPKFCTELTFLLATPPSRLVRFLLVWSGFGVTASWLKRKISWQNWKYTVIHVSFWVVSYAIYWGRILHH